MRAPEPLPGALSSTSEGKPFGTLKEAIQYWSYGFEVVSDRKFLWIWEILFGRRTVLSHYRTLSDGETKL